MATFILIYEQGTWKASKVETVQSMRIISELMWLNSIVIPWQPQCQTSREGTFWHLTGVLRVQLSHCLSDGAETEKNTFGSSSACDRRVHT